MEKPISIRVKIVFLYVFLVVSRATATEVVSGLERMEEAHENQKEACRDLEINESRKVDQRAPYNSNAQNRENNKDFKMRYVITRQSKNKYKVHIPVVFGAGDSYGYGRHDPELEALNTNKDFDKHTDKKYRKYVQQCIQQHNSKLVDSSQTRIELSIDNDASATSQHGIGVSRVSIIKTRGTTNVEAYAEDVTCAAVVHELLHLTGLCDEYQVNSFHHKKNKNALDPRVLGFNSNPELTRNADCRGVPDTNSVMGHHELALNGHSTTHTLKVRCMCENNCETSAAFKKKYPKNYISYRKGDRVPDCPAPFTQAKTMENDYSEKVIDSAGKIDSHSFAIVEVEPKPPALRNAHTRHIVYPGCISKNKKYYDCSATAYDNSDIEGCSAHSKKCQQDDAWLD